MRLRLFVDVDLAAHVAGLSVDVNFALDDAVIAHDAVFHVGHIAVRHVHVGHIAVRHVGVVHVRHVATVHVRHVAVRHVGVVHVRHVAGVGRCRGGRRIGVRVVGRIR